MTERVPRSWEIPSGFSAEDIARALEMGEINQAEADAFRGELSGENQVMYDPETGRFEAIQPLRRPVG